LLLCPLQADKFLNYRPLFEKSTGNDTLTGSSNVIHADINKLTTKTQTLHGPCGYSPAINGGDMFDSRPGHVVIVVNEVALRYVLFLMLLFSPVNTTSTPYTPIICHQSYIIPATQILSIARSKDYSLITFDITFTS
jgi:hypothetical protein